MILALLCYVMSIASKVIDSNTPKGFDEADFDAPRRTVEIHDLPKGKTEEIIDVSDETTKPRTVKGTDTSEKDAFTSEMDENQEGDDADLNGVNGANAGSGENENEKNSDNNQESKKQNLSELPTEEELLKLQKCFPLNSEAWLKGPRHGNVNDPLLDDDFVKNMILFGSQDNNNIILPDTALQQSMCHPDARFLNATDPLSDDRSIQLWIVRLTYLALHKVQHQFAISETQQRTKPNSDLDCEALANKHNIGKFDYECPDGKFFIVPIENLGLGAVMRTTAVSGLLAALSTNRSVLFVNHAPAGPKVIQQDWYHASCDRFDVQCFFHASSPCVLTHQELEEAPVLTGFQNTSKLFKNPTKMMEEEWFDKARAIVLPVKTVTRSINKKIPELLRQFTLDFMDALPSTSDPRKGVLEKVADHFVDQKHKDKVNQLISYGLVMYSLRPHLQSQHKLKDLFQKMVPHNKFHPEATLGLPIRGKLMERSHSFWNSSLSALRNLDY